MLDHEIQALAALLLPHRFAIAFQSGDVANLRLFDSVVRQHPPAGHPCCPRLRRIDPDAAAHWQVVMRDQLGGCRRLIDWLHQEGRLAPPWTPASAADMLWP